MNYGELKSITAFYLHRTDLDQYMNQFAEQAAERISAGAKLLIMETELSITFDENPKALPADFASFKSVRAQVARGPIPLSVYTKQQLESLSFGSTGGNPIGYALIGNSIEIQPFVVGQVVNVTYFARPGTLVDDGDTNLVLSKWPDLYIQAMVMAAAQSTQDTETEQNTLSKFRTAIAAANDHDKFAAMSGDAPQMQGS